MLVLLSFLSNTAFNFLIGLLLARFLGPDQYGRFALAVAIAVVVQTIAFDWARLATARFFADRVERDEPHLRLTVDTLLALLMGGVGALGLMLAVLPLALPLPPATMVLAIGLAIMNGAFDYWAALVRARFADRAYARMILAKNLISGVVTLGGAWWSGSAAVAIFGLGFSMAGGAVAVGAALAAPARPTAPFARNLARRVFAYALPVVCANLFYQTIPLVDRLLIARDHGFAPSGQFSLAYDIGIRVVAAVGSALDVLLFQIAVRADAQHGPLEARRQIGTNIGIVVAVLLPACLGLWLVMPSFEAVVVPPEFRGPFGTILRQLLPGLFCYGVIFFALHPLFQIERRTAPLVAVAVAAAAVNACLVWLWSGKAFLASFAQAQVAALGLAMGLLVIWAFWSAPVLPRVRDLGGAAVAASVMAAACHALPAMSPGPMALAVQVLVGAGVYAALAGALDVGAVRTESLARWSRRDRDGVNRLKGSLPMDEGQ